MCVQEEMGWKIQGLGELTLGRDRTGGEIPRITTAVGSHKLQGYLLEATGFKKHARGESSYFNFRKRAVESWYFATD